MENQQPIVTAEQQTLFDLTELAIVTTRSVGTIHKEIKELRQMIKDVYAANPTYTSHESTVKEVKNTLQQVKEQLNQNPEVAQLQTKLKDLRDEYKEKLGSISDYALEFERMSGNTQIERDGEVFEIVKTAKLVKRLQ